MIGLVLGAGVGLGLRYGLGVAIDPDTNAPMLNANGQPIWVAADIAETWIKPFGDAFIRLIRMLIMPLIFFTLTAGVVAMGDPKRLGSLGGRTIGMYMVTTIFAVSLGLIAATVFQPGAGFSGAESLVADPGKIQELLDTKADQDAARGLANQLLKIIPPNPFAALAGGDVLQVIFFSIIFGAGILVAKDHGAPLAKGVQSGSDVMIAITEFIMQLAPFGVFALITHVMASQGLAVLDNLLLLALALYAACLLHILLTYGLVIIKVILRLPMVRFFRGMTDAMAVAYSTASSSATLPVTIANAVENLGIKRPVASSVLPLGSTVNMDGTALYQGVLAVFAAQVFGIELSLGDYVMVALAATLVSVGTAGIPAVSLFLAFITLGVIGLTADQVALLVAFVFPFDRILDMMRTTTNITGDAAVATAVAKWEGELDEDTFREVEKL